MARDRDDRDDRDEDEDDEEERPRRRRRDEDDEGDEEVRPRRRQRDEDDDLEDRRPPRTTSPGTSRAAGIIWIVTGALAALVTLYGLFQMVLAFQLLGPDPFSICFSLFWLTLGLFGLMAGIKTVVGASTEPIANGVISILFALIFLGVAAVLFISGAGLFGAGAGRLFGDFLMIAAGVLLAYGLLHLLAGILCLAGRNEYVRWRRYLKSLRPKPDDRGSRRRRREREEEDDDDQPRKRRKRNEDDD